MVTHLRPEPPINVVFVEDHQRYRESLEFFLNNTKKVHCRSFETSEKALESIDARQPDVVLMDIDLPGMDGITCTKAIREQWPELPVLICTVHEDDERIFNALRAGAAGYLLKRASVDEIVDALVDILTGGSPMSPAIARKVVQSFEEKPLNTGPDALTPREQEVLDLMCTGLRDKEIADRLDVSITTIRTHLRHVYDKLHVQGRVEAVNKRRGR